MSSLRALFLRLRFSEKSLLVVFVLMIVVVWAWYFNQRAWRFQASARATGNELKIQQQWLDNRVSIEEAAKKTAARLDPSKTLDGTALNAAVVGMASEAGLRLSTTDPQTETTGEFTVHMRNVRLDRADWESLKKFYLALQARFPNIGIEQATLVPDRANPALITVTIRVSAPDIVR
jgi:hypothetical protein